MEEMLGSKGVSEMPKTPKKISTVAVLIVSPRETAKRHNNSCPFKSWKLCTNIIIMIKAKTTMTYLSL